MIDVILVGVLIWLLYVYFKRLIDGSNQKNDKYMIPRGPSFFIWFSNYLLNYYNFNFNNGMLGKKKDDHDDQLLEQSSERTIVKWFNEYKCNSYSVSFFGRPMVFTRDVQVARQVLNSQLGDYEKPPDSSGVLIRLARNGILMSEGEEWRKHRDIISIPFSNTKVRQMESMMRLCTRDMVDKLPKQGTIDVGEVMTKLTFDIIGMLSIGQRFSDKGTTSSNFHHILDEMIRPIRRLSSYIPLPSDNHLNQCIKELEDIIYQELSIIQEIHSSSSHSSLDSSSSTSSSSSSSSNQSQSSSPPLLASYLLNHSSKLTNDQIMSNIMTFLLAGHETSANLLTFILYLLSIHKDIQNDLYKSLINKNEDDNQDDSHNNNDLLEWIILETLRLFPPAPMIGRTATQDHDSLSSDIKLPKNSLVLVSVYAIHRNEQIYPSPNQFNPYRWKSIDSKSSSLHFLPFSSGSRVCIGQKFSITEAKIIISSIISQFSIEFNHTYPFEIYQRATLTPKNKVLLNIKKR